MSVKQKNTRKTHDKNFKQFLFIPKILSGFRDICKRKEVQILSISLLKKRLIRRELPLNNAYDLTNRSDLKLPLSKLRDALSFFNYQSFTKSPFFWGTFAENPF